jgi:transcriptional regulator with XRE-family HTH domain
MLMPANAAPMRKRGRPARIPESERPAWARRIAEARRRRGLSQAQLAASVNASQSAIGEYETGESEPSLETFARIAAALRTTAAWLVFGQRGFANAPGVFEPDVEPEAVAPPETLADFILETARMLAEEGMPHDQRTALVLGLELWQDAEALPRVTPLSERLALVLDRRRAILRRIGASRTAERD